MYERNHGSVSARNVDGPRLKEEPVGGLESRSPPKTSTRKRLEPGAWKRRRKHWLSTGPGGTGGTRRTWPPTPKRPLTRRLPTCPCRTPSAGRTGRRHCRCTPARSGVTDGLGEDLQDVDERLASGEVLEKPRRDPASAIEDTGADAEHKAPTVVPTVTRGRPGRRWDETRFVHQVALLEERVGVEDGEGLRVRRKGEEPRLYSSKKGGQRPQCRPEPD